MRIILASRSKARQEALKMLGLKFEVMPSNFDEKSVRNDDPRELAKKLGEEKAKAIDTEDAIVIAGDLFVVFEGKIYEKPKDKDEAFDVLKMFSGKELEIVGSVAVYNTQTGQMLSGSNSYHIKFRELTDNEVRDYVERYPVTNFAAGFDHIGEARFTESIKGDYPYVMAFPIPMLIRFLREAGLDV